MNILHLTIKGDNNPNGSYNLAMIDKTNLLVRFEDKVSLLVENDN